MQKIITILYPIAYLFAFSLISMTSMGLGENGSKKVAEIAAQKENMNKATFYPKLAEYISTLENEFDQIPESRKEELGELSEYISEKREKGEEIKITVICTHNSRRSHIGQLWLWAAAEYYGIENMHTYSGGTEATAFFPSAVNAMREAGFLIEKMDSSDNPVYEASLGEEGEQLQLFSKKYDHEVNPSGAFAALMVCTSADAACPIVPGADARFAIPYRDPKEFDGTDEEKSAYAERCRQIAREMFFVINNAV